MAPDPETKLFLEIFLVVAFVGWFIFMWLCFLFWRWVLRLGTRTVRDEWNRK